MIKTLFDLHRNNTRLVGYPTGKVEVQSGHDQTALNEIHGHPIIDSSEHHHPTGHALQQVTNAFLPQGLLSANGKVKDVLFPDQTFLTPPLTLGLHSNYVQDMNNIVYKDGTRLNNQGLLLERERISAVNASVEKAVLHQQKGKVDMDAIFQRTKEDRDRELALLAQPQKKVLSVSTLAGFWEKSIKAESEERERVKRLENRSPREEKEEKFEVDPDSLLDLLNTTGSDVRSAIEDMTNEELLAFVESGKPTKANIKRLSHVLGLNMIGTKTKGMMISRFADEMRQRDDPL